MIRNSLLPPMDMAERNDICNDCFIKHYSQIYGFIIGNISYFRDIEQMPGSLLTFRITDIIQETPDASSFVLENTEGDPVAYKAGQFLTLIFNTGHKEVRRSYSISSAPGIDDRLQITVKRVHNGEISRLLLDHYKKGDHLKALAPSGRFINDMNDEEAADIFLLAAGSGITPVFSLLKEMLYNKMQNNVVLIYQNHTNASTIFKRELENLAQRFAGSFTLINFVSRQAEQKGHNDPHRKLTNDRLEKIIPACMRYARRRAKFFICGPVSFMRMCQYTIMLMGFNEYQVKKEYFVIDAPPAPPLISDPQPHVVKIHSANNIIGFETQYPATILQSALNKGIQLPYSCKGGRCSACTARCIKGKVLMSRNDVLTEKEVSSGLVLTCVGYAETDIELEM
ncbi:MAG: ferredoxin--NADP reductase [Chitinophagaceae bacterium]|nr:ferredoxin--NADP reductase [Chitinophagaceae bacterium]